jgi:hypothetical protein
LTINSNMKSILYRLCGEVNHSAFLTVCCRLRRSVMTARDPMRQLTSSSAADPQRSPQVVPQLFTRLVNTTRLNLAGASDSAGGHLSL